MSTEDFKNKLIKMLQLEQMDADLAYDIFLDKLAEVLDFYDAIKINTLGVFQNKSGKGAKNRSEIIFVPDSQNKNLYLTLKHETDKTDIDFDESIFKPGGKQVKKSLSNQDATLKKHVIQKIEDLLASSEQLEDYNVWSDFLEKKAEEDLDEIEPYDTSKVADDEIGEIVEDVAEFDSVNDNVDELEDEDYNFNENMVMPSANDIQITDEEGSEVKVDTDSADDEFLKSNFDIDFDFDRIELEGEEKKEEPAEEETEDEPEKEEEVTEFEEETEEETQEELSDSFAADDDESEIDFTKDTPDEEVDEEKINEKTAEKTEFSGFHEVMLDELEYDITKKESDDDEGDEFEDDSIDDVDVEGYVPNKYVVGESVEANDDEEKPESWNWSTQAEEETPPENIVDEEEEQSDSESLFNTLEKEIEEVKRSTMDKEEHNESLDPEEGEEEEQKIPETGGYDMPPIMTVKEDNEEDEVTSTFKSEADKIESAEEDTEEEGTFDKKTWDEIYQDFEFELEKEPGKKEKVKQLKNKTSGDKKYSVKLMGIIGALAVAAVVVLYMFLSGGDEAATPAVNNDTTQAVTETGEGENIEHKSVTETDQAIDQALAGTDKEQTGNSNTNTKPVVKDEPRREVRSTPPPPVDNGALIKDFSKSQNINGLVFRLENKYYKQLSSHSKQSVAEGEVKRLRARGVSTYAWKVYISSKKSNWYRVMAGPFETKQQADNYK